MKFKNLNNYKILTSGVRSRFLFDFRRLSDLDGVLDLDRDLVFDLLDDFFTGDRARLGLFDPE